MRHPIFHTIAFKLTLWFTGIFSICSAFAFILFCFLATKTLEAGIDENLLEHASKFSASIHRNGLVGARDLAVLEAQAAGEKVIFFRLLYPTGEVFASSHMSYWRQVKIKEHALEQLLHTGEDVFQTVDIPANNQKARILYSFVSPNAILQTGIVMNDQARFLSAFQKVFISAMGFIIIFSAVAGWLLVSKALSGVQKITRTARDISGANLEARVVAKSDKNELGQLVSTFNSMLDRIEDLVINTKEMSDNIAHDLKSPITRIRGFAELALVDEENLENYRNMAANTIEESDRLLDMINTMLLISRAEAGQDDFSFQPTNLSNMVTDACELFAPLAEDKQIILNTAIQADISVTADMKMLQRAFSNLLDNAIKYSELKGQIDVIMAVRNNQVVIEVKDRGPGIDLKFSEKIFERFFRVDDARTSAGTGLGLSLARTIIRQHKGDITVTGRSGAGTVFKITLPHDNLGVI